MRVDAGGGSRGPSIAADVGTASNSSNSLWYIRRIQHKSIKTTPMYSRGEKNLLVEGTLAFGGTLA